MNGVALPAPMRLETEVVEVWNRTPAITRDRGDLDARMAAGVEVLEKLEDTDAITQAQLREALDVVLPKAVKAAGSRRNARSKLKAELLESGKLVERDGVFQLVLD